MRLNGEELFVVITQLEVNYLMVVPFPSSMADAQFVPSKYSPKSSNTVMSGPLMKLGLWFPSVTGTVLKKCDCTPALRH